MDPTTALATAEPIISRIAGRFRFREDDRDDAKQEARFAVLRALPAFDSSRGTFGAFASRIARNAMIDFQRSMQAQHRQAESIPADEPAPSGGAEADAFIQTLMTRPDLILSQRQSHLFQLFICTESRSELADILGITNDVADQRISRLCRSIIELAAA